MNLSRTFALTFCALSVGLLSTRAVTNYFVVAESLWVEHEDSYVIPLTNATQIAHARDLITYGEGAGQPIVVAHIEHTPDGINRDWVGGYGYWSWHVTYVEGFADNTIEILDGWPAGVELYPEFWPSMIGFWSYTVVHELQMAPIRPVVSSVWREGTSLKVATTNSVTPWTLVVEKATDLSNPNWQQVLSTWNTMTDYILTVPIDSDKAFFRIAGQALVP